MPNSIVSLDYRGEARIAIYPIEKGQFSAYNKVQMPFDVRLRMTCDGQGEQSRSDFLANLDKLKASLELCTIITPDFTYANLNLERYDYKRESHNGVTLLTVDAMFMEIRQAASAVYSPSEPQGSTLVSTGVVNTFKPTAAQFSRQSARR